MSDIATFVRARLAEQETDAHEVQKELSRWEREQDVNGPDGSQGSILAVTLNDGSLHPARVLAQVAAMRAIVDASVLMIENYAGGMLLDYTRETLRHLAAIWSSHPDYDPAWAPD